MPLPLPPTDPRLEPYRFLKDTNRTRWAGVFVAEGEKLVRRLLASELTTASILCGERFVERIAGDVPQDVPVYVIPDDAIDSLVGFNFHRGMLACGMRPANPPLADLASPLESDLRLAICPDVQDPENLGSVLRLCAAFGVRGLLLGRDCCDPFSRRVLRVSMGAAFSLPIRAADDLPADLEALRNEHQVHVAATVLDAAAIPLKQAPVHRRMALVFGNEGHGLTQEVVAACDARLTIPMRPEVDSLNVAVAAGVFLHHFWG